jgi:hypothetical protein
VSADTDVFAFTSALEGGRLDDALALRRGELLEGFDDDANEAWTSWLGFERDRLRVAWRTAVLARIEGGLDPGRSVELSAQLLAMDPLDEVAMRRTSRRWRRAGRPRGHARSIASLANGSPTSSASRRGSSCGRCTTAWSPASVAIGAARGRPTPRPSRATTSSAARSSSGASPTRSAATAAASTLVGPGGIGKTGSRAGLASWRRFADGAWFVALDIGAPTQLAGRIVHSSAHLAPGRSRSRRCAGRLPACARGAAVLDNFETA